LPIQNSISNAIKGDAQLGGAAPFFNQYSFEFDGSTDFVEIGSPTSIQNLTSQITISFWIKAPKVFSTNYYTPLSKGEYAAVGSQWTIQVNTANATNTSGGGNDGTDLRVYLDGQLEATGVGKGRTLYNGNRSLKLGRLTGTPSVGRLQGNLDEVAIFGTALGLTEAQTIYNGGVPNDISSLSPVSWWRMGDAATWTGKTWDLIDQGSGGNNGFSDTLPFAARTTDIPT
jgi:hypothetical protein